jgi:hypothetical protein
MFDSLYSVINWTLIAIGLVSVEYPPQSLGQQDLAMIAATVVHAWRLFPFGVVIFIAGSPRCPMTCSTPPLWTAQASGGATTRSSCRSSSRSCPRPADGVA